MASSRQIFGDSFDQNGLADVGGVKFDHIFDLADAPFPLQFADSARAFDRVIDSGRPKSRWMRRRDRIQRGDQADDDAVALQVG